MGGRPALSSGTAAGSSGSVLPGVSAAVMNGPDRGLASSGIMRRAAPGAGAALALVHGLYPGDRDRVTLFDEVLGQRLRRRQGSGPGISIPQQPRRVPH